MHPSGDPELAKTQLRSHIRNSRRALTAQAVGAASRDVAKRLAELIRPDDVVGFFAGVGGEITVGPETVPVGRAAFPRVASKTEIHFHEVARTPTTPGAFGIPEPSQDEPTLEPEDLDVLLVPGLAFTQSGDRLGQGGGYYDRLMPRLRDDAKRVGLCHGWQVVETLPTHPHDVRVTHIVTENETFVADPS